jgi:hypothetical protein
MIPRTTLNRSAIAFASLLAVGASACTSDQIVGTTTPQAASTAPQDNIFTAHAAFQRYVAVGTSISAGVQSDGLTAGGQLASWPNQLAGMTLSSLKQPLVSGTGCAAPVIAPILLNLRLSGEPASQLDPSQLKCSPLLFGLAPPFDNVALNGALTINALGLVPDPSNAKIYAEVLQPGMSQVSTMVARNPTLVSIELGSNEVLSGINGTGLPPNLESLWQPYYDLVIGAIPATSRAVLVGLITDVADVQALRLGSDLWLDAPEFSLFNVSVSSDCETTPNLIFVPFKVPLAVEEGLARAQQHLGPATLSCADGGIGVTDYVLTPAEAGSINTQMSAIDKYIQQQAGKKFAYFPLGALYDTKNAKGPFSVVKLMTSPAPFGPYFSLDGLHPSAAGQAILAKAAAQALNSTYGLGIPIP